jgi:hypothetical protein
MRGAGWVVVVVLGVAVSADGAVLCRKKNGTVVFRDEACKRKETAIDLSSLGAVGPTGPAGSPDTPDQVRAKFFQATTCPGNDAQDDMVLVGTVCVDKYEASVWSTATGGTQYGASTDDYPCGDGGQDCTSTSAIFARNVPNVVPSRYITWFQAQAACTNAGKRLLTSAEWQAAAAGTPDPGSGGNGVTTCNTTADDPVPTGSAANCASVSGTRDMVGNVWEWVSDWSVPSSTIKTWTGFSDDALWLGSVPASPSGPAPFIRGGGDNSGTQAGPFAVGGFEPAQGSFSDVGFRCAR